MGLLSNFDHLVTMHFLAASLSAERTLSDTEILLLERASHYLGQGCGVIGVLWFCAVLFVTLPALLTVS